jgi:hypothetical protein
MKRDKLGNNADIVKLSAYVRGMLDEGSKMLGQMSELLMKQRAKKKLPPQELEVRRQKLEQMKDILEQLATLERGGVVVDNGDDKKTLTELRANIMGMDRINQYTVNNDRDVNNEEQEVLNRFAKRDQDLDAQISKLNDGLVAWKNKAMDIGDNIEIVHKGMDRLTKEVDKTNENLLTSNRNLKKIVAAYRAPNKFCLDIILLFCLVGLVGVVWNMLR